MSLAMRRIHGYVLLPVAVAITLIAAIAFVASRESAIEVDMAANELAAARAEYVAQAGLQHALRETAQQGCGAYSDLSNISFGGDQYSTTLTTDLGTTTSYSITVDQDSWINSDSPANNYAADADLQIDYVTGKISRPLYRYNLSSLPSKAVILSATAWFYVEKEHPEGPVEIHRITAGWTETDATWASISANMDGVTLASIPSQPTAAVWVSINLTSQVQAWVNGEANFGIALDSTSEGTTGKYASRESAYAPYLEVVVGTPPTSPAILKSAATLQNGVSRTISRNDVVLYQHPPGMHQLQPDAVDGEDAEIWDQAPNNNYGAAAETWVSSASSDTTRSLLRFDLGAIPAGARILRADLSLERQSGSGADQPVSAHRILNPWSEEAVTWNQRNSGTNWDTAGADFDNTAVATTPVGPVNQRYAWNLTPLVQGWVDGSYPNHGVALVAAIAGMPGERFYTSDDADPTRWPSLSITYACACGTACFAPQGSGNLLMVVINPTTLVAADATKKALFESWGYTVSVLSESANQSAYDAAVALSDVVFISETVNANGVGTKLKDAPIGVVSQDGDYNAALGFATGSAWTVGTAINVTDNDHYITAPFALGSLEIYRNGMEQLTVNGTEAAGLQTLADASSTGALVLFDTGDTTGGDISGETAAGRRVMLPLGRESNFNWDQLNNNGRLIVQRALEWGMNLTVAAGEPLILSTDSNAILGTLSFTDNDLAQYDPDTDTASLFFDGSLTTLTEDIDAVHLLANGHIVLSTRNPATLGGISFEAGDLVDYDPVTDSATLIFDGSALFTDPSEEIKSVFVRDNGNLIMSTDGDATLGSLSFTDRDLVEYDPTTGNASLFFDGSLTTLGEDITAVHVLANGHLVLGAKDTTTLGGVSFEAGDMVDYDPVADLATLIFDGSALFTDPTEKIISVHVGPGSGSVSGVDPFKVLFVVGNVGGPGMTTEEIDHQTLIESWGHTVEIIDDGASQAEFDTAVANNDVVFTTNDITAGTLGTKLVNATIGVVTSEDNLSDEFGLASAIAWESGTVVEINDNSHYITSAFPTGTLTILTASESLAYVTGTLSPDLGQLASSTSGYGIVTLEAGATMFGGGSAAGRRAQLPWGGSGFDPNNLNADGLTILKRALEWGAGTGTTAATGPIAHWKLDETSGTTAVDSVGGYDGTLINWPSTPDWVAGKLDGGLSFDGSNDYIDVSSMNPRSYDDFTVSAWYKSADSSVSDDEYIFEHNDNFTNEVTFGPTDDGTDDRLRFGFANGGSATWDPHYGTSDIVDQQWHLVVGVRSAGRIKLYVDGVLETDEPDAHAGATVIIDGDGPFIGDLPGNTEQVHGVLDDVRLYDRALDDTEIADLFAEGGGGGSGAPYTETYQQWSATSDDTWQTVDLSVYGVPANAVVEVAVTNLKTDAQRWGGVRAVGSSLERRFQLQEAEGDGVDAVTMHVQTDASSQIQHYSDNTADISFVLLGYWIGGSYVEVFETFGADASNSWIAEDVSDDGLGPNQVAEIVMVNTSTGNERLAGVRTPGSSLQRRFDLHEAESDGIDAVTLMVNTGPASTVEVYAESSSDIDFYVIGYWSSPIGTYTEAGGVSGQVSSSSTWETTDLTSFGVPANTIAQFVITNDSDGSENNMGVRATGSSVNRLLDLHEAESGGSDIATMHVNADDSSQVEWYAESGGAERLFYPVGWWVLSP